MAERKPPDMSVWGLTWNAALLLGGLVFALLGFGALPPSRENLAVAEAIAPVHVTSEIVTESSGRHGTSTYRKQNIVVAGGGRSYLVASPPRTLWVSDIDRLDPGTRVQFLVDPDRSLIYEARLGERVLLAYGASANQQLGGAVWRFGFGLFMVAIGGFGLWQRREGLGASPAG